MSKGNMLLGHARGKVGSLVFARANGQQIVRSRAEVVRNPQTTTQMVQRIVLNTVAQAYSRMVAITDHSFEGIQKGQKSMSYFMSKNMENLRARISQEIAAGGDFYGVSAFTPVGQNGFAPNAYMIAKGTLPEIPVTYPQDSQILARIGFSGGTYGDLINAFGLQRGDQLTFVAMHGTAGKKTDFHFARIILDPVNEAGEPQPLSVDLVVNGAINCPSPRNEGSFSTIAFSDNQLEFGFAGTTMTGAAVIVSRKNADGSWLRSNATILLDESRVQGFFYNLGEALDLLAGSDINAVNSLYLNNSGQGNVATTDGVNVLAVKTLGGADVELVSLRKVGDYLKGISRGGTAYYMKATYVQSLTYGKYATDFDAIDGSAPVDGTNDNTVGFPAGATADAYNNMCGWGIAHGMTYGAFNPAS